MKFRRKLIERMIKELPCDVARAAFRRLFPTTLECDYFEQFLWAEGVRIKERAFQRQKWEAKRKEESAAKFLEMLS